MAGNTFDAGTVYAGARLDRDEFQRDLKAMRAELQKFEKQQWKVPVQADLDEGKARKDLEAFTRKPRTLKVDLVLNTAQAKRDYAAFKTGLTNTRANLTLNTAQAKRDYATFKGGLTATRADLNLNTAPAKREYTAFKATMKESAAKVPVVLDAAKAKREWQAFRAETSRNQTARVKVEANTATALAKLLQVSAAMRALNTMRSILHINVNATGAISQIMRLSALVMALGGLAGVVGGLAGAIGGIGAAALIAAGGLAPVILAFSGVGKALSAMNDAQKNAAKEASQAAKQQASAAYSVGSAHNSLRNAVVSAAKARRDAVRSVSDAERQASRSIESALQQQQSAQRQLVSAQREARAAQVELTHAWEEGKRALQDLQDQLDMGKLDQEQAAFDLKDAKKDLDEAVKSGDQDRIARADLAYRRQLETIDQLNKRVQRLGTDNGKAQAAGVAGSEQYRAALERVRSTQESVTEAERAAGQASRDVARAREDGIRAVAQAREDAQDRIQQADQSVLEAQRALNHAMSQMADIGTSSADKVAEAFAGLSPAAADFARYLFSLKPLLEQLSATAATNFFPPLREGMDTLLTRMPEIDRVIGQLAAGMGNGLKLVLTELANPFWSNFFGMIGNAAGTIIPMMFQSLMNLAQAGAVLVTALMPIIPASLGILDALSAWIAQLAGPLVQALSNMFPAVHAFIGALGWLGPLLVALSPILNVLGVAFSQILGAAMQALIPILTALTPLFVTLATTLAEGFGAVMAWLTPHLVAFSEWASENPGKVAAIAAAVAGLALAFQGMIWISQVIGALGPLVAAFKPLLAMVGGTSGAMAALGTAVRFLLGPWGLLIGALITAYSTSAPFRDAINNLLGALGQVAGMLIQALLPVFNTLAQVFTIVAGVAVQLVGALAEALVPILNMLAGVLMQLVSALLPPLMQIIGALMPVVMSLASVFVQLLTSAIVPIIDLFAQLIGFILPPLVAIIQSVLIPVIQFLASVFSGVLSWVLTNVLLPAINGIIPALGWLGDAAMWLWTNAIKPAFDFIGTAARVLFAVIMTVLITPLLIAWNLLSAAAMWLWENGIRPAFDAIGKFIVWVWTSLIKPALDALVWLWQNVVAPAAIWLWVNVLQPTFQAIGAFIKWVWENLIKPALDALVWFWQNVLAPAAQWLYNNIIKPMWEGIGAVIRWVWENVIKPAFDAVSNGLQWLGQRFEEATNWIRDIWNRIKGFLAKPINFMIDVVWNKGVVPAWNAVAGLVGLGPINTLPLIPENATGGPIGSNGGTHPGRGGMLRGPGNGTSDKILGIDAATKQATSWVSNDEFVVRAAVAQRVPHFLHALNAGQVEAMQAAGGSGAKMPGFGAASMGRRRAKPLQALAGGGPVLQQSLDRAIAFARGESGKPYQWGGVGNPSWDCSGFMSGITNALNNRPVRSRLGTTATMPWGGFAPGMLSAFSIGNSKTKGHMAGTLAGVNVESGGSKGVHYGGAAIGADNGMFEQKWHLPVVGGNFVSGGGGGGGSSWILDKMREAFDSLTNPAIDAVRNFVGNPPPEWRRVPPALATKMRDTVRDWIFSKAPADGGGDGVDISGISGPVVEQVREVARRYGWGDGPEWDAIRWIVQKESSWNPNAANSGSSARGLFQKMTSYHGPVEPTPAGQANWGLNYIKGRYGTPTAAKAFHIRNGSYDMGGELRRGMTMVRNMMPHSETVVPLPPEMMDNLLKVGADESYRPIVIESGRVGDNVSSQSGDGESLVELARAIATEVRDQAPLVGSINVPVENTSTAKDAADEVVFKLRSVKRGGVHASGRTR